MNCSTLIPVFLNVHNKYEILNSSGEFIFLGAETTPPLTRIFCFGGHPFEIAINTLPGRGAYSWNAKGSEVLKLTGNFHKFFRTNFQDNFQFCIIFSIIFNSK